MTLTHTKKHTSVYTKICLGLVGGALCIPAFAPLSWSILTFLSLVVCYWLLDNSRTPRQALLIGLAYGLGFFASGISWVTNSIYATTQSWAIAILANAMVVLACGGLVAISFYLYRRLMFLPDNANNGIATKYGRGINIYLLMPLCWMFAEVARLHIMEGFPWLLIGYSQIDTPLSGYAPLLGVLGMSWITALLAAIIYHTIQCRNSCMGVINVALIFTIVGGGWLLQQVEWFEDTGKRVKATIVQANIDQDKKWDPRYFGKAVQSYVDLTDGHWDSDLILWPETAVAAPWGDVAPGFSAVKQQAVDTNTSLLFGVLTQIDRFDYRKGMYNSLLNINNDAKYHKVHLVPFGERVPLASVFSAFASMLNIPMSEFIRPALIPTIPVGEFSVAPSICFEIAFGDEMAARLPEADFFVNISNDAWFLDTLEPAQHLQIARMRAKELGRAIVRSTNTGISAIINPHGEVIARLEQREKTTITADIAVMSGTSWYARYHDWSIYLILLLITTAILLLKRRHQSSTD